MAKVKKIYDMCAITGTYTNKNNEQKNEYTNIGKFFVMDDNSFFSVVKTVPVGAWDGKVSYFEQKEKEQNNTSPVAHQSAPVQTAQVNTNESLPF
ncbi:MAG TPA: hypothetical protein DCS19_07995 [Flavobacterium sp.]|nr:hypothetical protein [Flavobacterium sp.]